ncbi:MAG: hypothetical protein KA175_11065 [Flavobacteriales bacterium]|nr:hypothetical protein [Flavobacteriales bacterium]MBP6698151.1 hypothetical protein [Flavobacteriales bacterium]
MKHSITLFLFTGIQCVANGQTLLNGDLDGTVDHLSCLPDQWQVVAHTDPICEATNTFTATPDLSSVGGADPFTGVMGTPFSGDTYLTGIHGTSPGTGWTYHEGIQQAVGGFVPGAEYRVSFYQCVDARTHVRDTIGSWSVHVGTILAGITETSASNIGAADLGLQWEYRELYFVAPAATLTLKFLPQDDDDSHALGIDSLNGGLSMGIDLITIASSQTGVPDNTDPHAISWRYDAPAELLRIDDQPFANQRYSIADMTGRILRVGRLLGGIIDLNGLPASPLLLRFDRPFAVARFLKI